MDHIERIAAWDMGPVNTAWAVIEVRYRGNELIGLRLLGIGMMPDLIDDLVEGFQPKATKFRRAVAHIVKSYQPTWALFERFQQRGMRRGAVDEKVSIMNGLIVGSCLQLAPKTQIDPVTAGQWKNRFSQFFGREFLDQLYATHKGYAHMIDALLIALYSYDLFAHPKMRSVLPRLLLHVTQSVGPAPSRVTRTSGRVRSKRARPTSQAPAKKAGARTTTSTSRR